jgi:type IV secretory pathway VirB10-like protein
LVTVTVRHVVLAITAVAVLAMGVYLFVEVHSTAQATPAPAATEATATTAPTPVSHTATTRPLAPATTPAPAPHDEPAPVVNDDQPFDVEEAMRANVKLELVMDQANKAYDHQDYYQAKLIATRVLAKEPGNIRMMRIMVSGSCMDNDLAVAQKYYAMLPSRDREQMKRRCDATGVTLQDPAP